VRLLYFAWVRQKVGHGEEEFAPPPNVETIAALIESLRGRGAGYAQAFADPKLLCCAVNQEHADFDAPIRNDDEIAFFPPVTGG
jgi:molybdopterin synthase sulfur carrier subunit